MAGRGNPLVRNYSAGNASETTFLEDFILESEEQERVVMKKRIHNLYTMYHLNKLITFKDIKDLTL